MNTGEYWIRELHLDKHPEGGWYREVYRSEDILAQAALPERFTGDRCHSTAIYFLLQGMERSTWHRIRQDEVWHFYEGSSLTLHLIDLAGNYSTQKIGRDISVGERLMFVVSAGWWFGAMVDEPESYALVGCTVAPGFEFDDFEMPSREQLLEWYPQHRDAIERLS